MDPLSLRGGCAAREGGNHLGVDASASPFQVLQLFIGNRGCWALGTGFFWCEWSMLGSTDPRFPAFYRMTHQISRFCWRSVFIHNIVYGFLFFKARGPRVRGLNEAISYLSVGSTSSFLVVRKAGRCLGLVFV